MAENSEQKILQDEIIIYDLETSGLNEQDDILQVSALRYNIAEDRVTDEFSEYLIPTGPIGYGATRIHGLFEKDGDLFKKNGGIDELLDALPGDVALTRFVKWVLRFDGSNLPAKVICVGFNNSNFDDSRLLIQSNKNISPVLFMLMRKRMFSSDMRFHLRLKGTLAKNFSECGGSTEEQANLHEALQDCRALLKVMRTKGVSFKSLVGDCVSFEMVWQKRMNPLLTKNLLTPAVANKMIGKLTYEEFTKITDKEVKEKFESAGISNASITSCLKRREVHRGALRRQNSWTMN